MSYAGPASRTKRTPELQPAGAPASRAVESHTRHTKGLARFSSADHGQATAFAAGIAVGLALGAGVALLFAPESGLETRRALVRRGRRVGRRSRDAWDDLRDELRNAVRSRRRARRLKRVREEEAADAI